jgi:hypothetical protein
MMHQKSEVADKLQLIGFQYIQCGSCCKETSKDSNLVMVYPKEIRDIVALTGFGWEDIVHCGTISRYNRIYRRIMNYI